MVELKNMNNKIKRLTTFMASLSMLFLIVGCDSKVKEQQVKAQQANELSDAQVEDITRRSYQYVALYNVNNKFAISQGDFAKPEKVLFYTARTEGYSGEPVGGVDRRFGHRPHWPANGGGHVSTHPHF
jgi:hypothetical protein